MSYNGRSGASQDPLEKYRQALRRQSPGLGSRDLAEEPPAPVEPPVPEAPEEQAREAPADSISVFVREVQRLWSDRLDALNQDEGVLNRSGKGPAPGTYATV